MIVIWRGWGILVIPIAALAFFLATAIKQEAGIQSPALSGVVYVLSSGLAALGIWLFAQKIESQPGRVLIDKNTGREFEVRKNAGSLFFIPTRYWSYIVVAIGALVAIQQVVGKH
jgi:hypothetical protein